MPILHNPCFSFNLSLKFDAIAGKKPFFAKFSIAKNGLSVTYNILVMKLLILYSYFRLQPAIFASVWKHPNPNLTVKDLLIRLKRCITFPGIFWSVVPGAEEKPMCRQMW